MKNFLEIPKSSLKKFFCITKYLDRLLVKSMSLRLILKLEADKNNGYRGFSRKTFDLAKIAGPTGIRTLMIRVWSIVWSMVRTLDSRVWSMVQRMDHRSLDLRAVDESNRWTPTSWEFWPCLSQKCRYSLERNIQGGEYLWRWPVLAPRTSDLQKVAHIRNIKTPERNNTRVRILE